MSRYKICFNLNRSPNKIDTIKNNITKYLFDKGFRQTQYKKECVFKKGEGFLTDPKYIQINYSENEIYLQAWIKFSIMPFVHIIEMDYTKMRFLGYASKYDLSVYVSKIKGLIEIANRES